MCEQDIRIGRKKYTKISTVTSQIGTSTQLVGAAENRTHLFFACNGVDSVIVAPGEADATGFGAIGLSRTKPPVDFDVETHGDVVTKPWNCSGLVSAQNILVIETFWKDKQPPGG